MMEGTTWNLISSSPWGLGSGSGSDGCTRADAFGNLFYQTIHNGFWMSSDSGVSWSNIGGPGMSIDSRFVIANCEIYAADTSGALSRLSAFEWFIFENRSFLKLACNAQRFAMRWSSFYAPVPLFFFLFIFG